MSIIIQAFLQSNVSILFNLAFDMVPLLALVALNVLLAIAHNVILMAFFEIDLLAEVTVLVFPVSFRADIAEPEKGVLV
jgi:hypothetical protein